MKPSDVQLGQYIEYGVGSNDKDSKLKIDDHVRISKYQNNFVSATLIGLRKPLQINKVKNTVPWTYVISNLSGEKIGKLYEKELQKTTQQLD